MRNPKGISVFYQSRTIGGRPGRIGLEPVCHSCEKALGLKSDDTLTTLVPPEALPLVFSAQAAATELGVPFKIIDISQLSLLERLKTYISSKPVPRINIGEEFMTGTPTTQDIIDFYLNVSREH